ncbi:MAG: DUF1993 domain-containing protein [Parasphingorhabdus sp.]|nr:DUF1993 domain-containing protein [Parasphingorhabdus sp.]
MTIFEMTVPVFKQMLGGLDRQLDKAAEHTGDAKDAMLGTRLAPDMHPLSTQIYFTCSQAVQTLRRLAGKTIADLEDPGESFAKAKALVASTLAHLETATPADMAHEADRLISFDLPNGMAFELGAEHYVRDWALPQFYFHATMSYAILRHLGVALGKADFVSHMTKYAKRA